MLYRGLVQASADLEVLPDVAESWEVDRGGARYIFRLATMPAGATGALSPRKTLSNAGRRCCAPVHCNVLRVSFMISAKQKRTTGAGRQDRTALACGHVIRTRW